MCRFHEGAVAEIQGKIAQSLKKSVKSFGNSKIMPTFASAFRLFAGGRMLSEASLAQLARARDL